MIKRTLSDPIGGRMSMPQGWQREIPHWHQSLEFASLKLLWQPRSAPLWVSQRSVCWSLYGSKCELEFWEIVRLLRDYTGPSWGILGKIPPEAGVQDHDGGWSSWQEHDGGWGRAPAGRSRNHALASCWSRNHWSCTPAEGENLSKSPKFGPV